jgi:hypothetical protein
MIAAFAMLGLLIAKTAAARDLDEAVHDTISSSYADSEGCKEMGERAAGMLVFLAVGKGGRSSVAPPARSPSLSMARSSTTTTPVALRSGCSPDTRNPR